MTAFLSVPGVGVCTRQDKFGLHCERFDKSHPNMSRQSVEQIFALPHFNDSIWAAFSAEQMSFHCEMGAVQLAILSQTNG